MVVRFWRMTPLFLSRFLLLLFRNSPFYLGFGIRYLCVFRLCRKCGEKVVIFPNVTINNIQNLAIGTNVTIHENCYIDAFGGVEIGSNVAISHNVSLVSFDHKFDGILGPIKDAGTNVESIVLSDDVWVGAGCRILKGARLDEGSILGAGSVLLGEVDKMGIYAGIPAKLIRYRS
jgi:acetyltransferase-like isoleucine patch superfamily enzyme